MKNEQKYLSYQKFISSDDYLVKDFLAIFGSNLTAENIKIFRGSKNYLELVNNNGYRLVFNDFYNWSYELYYHDQKIDKVTAIGAYKQKLNSLYQELFITSENIKKGEFD